MGNYSLVEFFLNVNHEYIHAVESMKIIFSQLRDKNGHKCLLIPSYVN